MSQFSFDFCISRDDKVAVDPVPMERPREGAVAPRTRAKRIRRDAVVSAQLPLVAVVVDSVAGTYRWHAPG